MKKIDLFFATLATLFGVNAQPAVTMKLSTGITNPDLQSILYFEGIDAEDMVFKGKILDGKNYQIVMKEFVNGVLAGVDTVFDSKEHFSFRINADSLRFKVLTKETGSEGFKIEFQFDGFRKARNYKILPGESGMFALKDFCGSAKEVSVNPNNRIYLLSYMMPYTRKDKSRAYCEVAQSGTDPEKLFEKYAIPHYYLIEIRFE
jgi:hypothetical protein